MTAMAIEQERRAAMAERVRAYRARQRAEDAAGYPTTGAATEEREPAPPPTVVATARGARLVRATGLRPIWATCGACDRLMLAEALVRGLFGWRCADAAGCAAGREGRAA